MTKWMKVDTPQGKMMMNMDTKKIEYLGINPLDPDLNIDWPIPKEQSIISAKDLNLPNLRDFIN